MSIKHIDPENITDNVFTAIGKNWMLVSAEKDDGVNPMTASWGGLGVLWNKNVATIYIRPTRYTYELLEKNDRFILSFFGEHRRIELMRCGSVSGRDVDKVSDVGFNLIRSDKGVPYFDEAEITLICRKIYFSDLNPDNFLTKDAHIQYPEKDYHRMYIGEIIDCFIKE